MPLGYWPAEALRSEAWRASRWSPATASRTRQLVLARTVASMNRPCVTLGRLAATFRCTLLIARPGGQAFQGHGGGGEDLARRDPRNPSSLDSAKEKLLA